MLADLAHDAYQFGDIRGSEARGGFVEQDELGIQRQCAANLQQALLAVGQVARFFVGKRRQAHKRQDAGSAHARIALFTGVARGVQHHVHDIAAERVVQAHEDVFNDRHLAKELDILESARHAGSSNLRRGAAGEGLAFEGDGAASGFVDAGEHIHHGALARAVGSDQAVHGVAHNVHFNAVEGREAAKLHEHAVHLEHAVAGASAGDGGRRGSSGGGSRSLPGALGVAAGLDHLVALNPVGVQLPDGITHEAHDAIGQVIDHQQDHQAEDGEPVVGDVVDHERKHRQPHQQRDGRRQLSQGALLLCQGKSGIDAYQHGDAHGQTPEQLQVRQQIGQHYDDDGAQYGTVARLAPAHDHRQQELYGQLDGVRVG